MKSAVKEIKLSRKDRVELAGLCKQFSSVLDKEIDSDKTVEICLNAFMEKYLDGGLEILEDLMGKKFKKNSNSMQGEL